MAPASSPGLVGRIGGGDGGIRRSPGGGVAAAGNGRVAAVHLGGIGIVHDLVLRLGVRQHTGRALGVAARLREAAKLGFKAAIIPHRVRKSEPLPDGIQVLEARSLREALMLALVKEDK